MPLDPAVRAALEAALGADPKATALRLHLASALLEAGDGAEALSHFTHVLAADPSHVEALRGAARAARACGDPRAEAYERLLAALGQAAPAVSHRPLAAVPASAAAQDAEEDEEEADDAAADDDDAADDAGGTGPDRLKVIQAADRFVAEAETPRTTLADVGGMEEVKRRLFLSFLGPLRNPEVRKAYGKSLRGGLLLYGPPGCGKTFIARATAGELGARFLNVGLADVLDMWLGESERKLHEIFETARRSAPTVLFFDEIDALGHKRSQLRNHAGRNIVNALLAELDGVQAENEGVFVLGATNHPWDVDAALRRPGRFDRMVLVLPPDEDARRAILRHHLQERPAEGVDVSLVAGRTRGFSGADLAHLCNTAAELAMESSLTTGRTRPISGDDFGRAIEDVKPSVRPWFDTAKNYAMFANEGGVYDDLLAYMKANRY